MIVRGSILSDAEVVKLVRLAGQPGAEALYDKYSAALLLSIIRIIPQKKLAEEVFVQVFIKIWNSFDLYEPDKQGLFSWMVVIARNMAIVAITFNTNKSTC